jgi:autoinducer 2 (AI-2) kinase
MKRYLLSIDAGTGSGRVLIFDELGNELAMAQEEWSHHSEEGVANSMNFDYLNNWKLLVRCIRDAIQTAKIDPNDIVALSASSMREGIVLYDKDKQEIWSVANVDARADQEVRALKEQFEGIEEEFYEISGQTFALGALPRLLWVKNNRPDIYEKTCYISMISDWILFKLSGTIASDPSNAGTAGIFSLTSREWMPDMARRVGIKADIFPPTYESGTSIGHVCARAATQTGLSTSTKVVMGGGDVQIGTAALGAVEHGDVAVLGGTFWQQVVNIETPLVASDMNIRVNPHVAKGITQAEGITFFSGLVMRWFRDAFCDMERVIANESGRDTYSVLEEMARNVPAGSYGILPIFSDSMKYGKWYHAAPSFLNLGLDAEKYNKASMFRSLQENACIVSQINLENIYSFTGVEPEKIIFASGASKGFLWPQILADVTGKEILIPEVKEATSLGCAIAAGVGAGIYGSITEAAKQLVRWERVYKPNMQNHKVYSKLKEQWIHAYKAQIDLVDANITTSMWKAPGL